MIEYWGFRVRVSAYCFSGIAAVAVLLVASPSFGRDRHRYAQDGWTLTLTADSFLGSTRCALRSIDKRMVYQPGAVGFRLGRRADTTNAWYRKDDEAPVRWQDRYPSLVASNVAIDGSSLSQPTDGWVWIPIEEIASTKIVAIRTGSSKPIQSFKIRGFSSMLADSRRLGCASDAAFGAG